MAQLARARVFGPTAAASKVETPHCSEPLTSSPPVRYAALEYGALAGVEMQFDQLKRRKFITLLVGAAAWPFAVRAQQPGKLPRVGVLEPYAATDPGYRVSQAFHDTGIVEGRDILVEWRYAEGHIERIPALATDLAGLKPDALVAVGDVAIRALRAQTATIPIVAGTDDLVGEGHAASLSHGPFRTEVLQGIARQLARVLKGVNPAELPVEQPTRFELVINLKTANALGLPIPPLLLTRADEVIE
jgi:ABC-type uncharacterized transport system substrate-binding protein